MGLRHGDLKHTILKRISFDEFIPKTGKEKDVAVIGFYLNHETPGQDLYSFLNNSVIENRDIEVSPNPNENGYYMVFIEMDRGPDLLYNVRQLVKEIERVSGKLNWLVETPYLDEAVPLKDADNVIQQDPAQFMPAGEYKDYISHSAIANHDYPEEEDFKGNQEEDQISKIMEFLGNSNLLDATIDNDVLTIKDARGSADLNIVAYGPAPEIMNDLSISESAVRTDFDQYLHKKLKSMLGEMKAVPIDEYVVIYDPNKPDVLVTQPC